MKAFCCQWEAEKLSLTVMRDLLNDSAYWQRRKRFHRAKSRLSEIVSGHFHIIQSAGVQPRPVLNTACIKVIRVREHKHDVMTS